LFTIIEEIETRCYGNAWIECLPSWLPYPRKSEYLPLLWGLRQYLFPTDVEEFANRCWYRFCYVGAFLYDNPPCPHYLNVTQIRFSDVSNLQNVMRASLDVFPSLSDHSLAFKCLFKLLNALSGIKHLSLGCSTTKV